ncbi:MAG: hypothetical protein KF819_14240 [Labilithrix sp.]|nr:hypothetical protein [Labilithrix sp.]
MVLAASTASACVAPAERTGASREAITSSQANILDFRFSASVLADAGAEARNAVVTQLMYVQGILTTAGDGNGKVGQVELSDISASPDGAKKKITYNASLPVAFPKDRGTPQSYELALPNDVTALDAFNGKYDGRCGHQNHGQGNFWMDYAPKAEGCSLDDGDVVRVTAGVSPSSKETHDKYPEYDLLWADGRLDAVAIFSIVTSNESNDWGYRERDEFLGASKELLWDVHVDDKGGSESVIGHTTITGQYTVGGSGKPVTVDTFLVHELDGVGADFDRQYDELSERADIIMYSGHAGLGKHVNALARKGRVPHEKYQIVVLNGCQSFAHIDTTLNDRRIAVNGSSRDPAGTAFMDVVANALPGYADKLAEVSSEILKAAANADSPRSYASLLDAMPPKHVVVVFGEEDNRYRP